MLITFDNQWSSPYKASPEYPYQLMNAEGKYLFLLNKTEWAYFACTDPAEVIKNVKDHGANVIRVHLEGTPYYDYLGYDLWPWGGTRKNPDYSTFNEKYWEEVEKRISLAGKNGIGIDLVLYFTLRPDTSDIAMQKPYWDKVIKRLSRYSNILTWEIMNEYIGNEAFQDSAGSYFKAHDPFHHPICSSDGTTENALWPSKPWMDLAVVHTCTGQDGYDLEHWYLNIARNTRQHGKPSVNNETGREKRHRNDDGVHRRKQAWLFNNAGCYWTWHSWDGCEGINEPSYRFDGWQYLKPMREFYESLPFWKLEPSYTTCYLRENDVIHTTMSTSDREYTVTYCCTRGTGEYVKARKALIRIKNGIYQVTFFSPAKMEKIKELTFESKGLRNEYEIDLPSFTDDILILIREQEPKERSLIEDTL